MDGWRGMRAVLVIAPVDFRDEEYAEPKRILEQAGFEVHTASLESGTCHGKGGMTAQADLDLVDALEQSWDVTVFCGGTGAEVYFDDENAHALASKAVALGNVLGAICIAPTILSRAGLIGTERVTSFPTAQAEIEENGACWTGRDVEVAELSKTDAKLVTANGPDAATKFGEALVDAADKPDGRFGR